MTVLAPHAKPELESRWISVLNGRVTASGAPSLERLAAWKERGATDVVTLQRADEARAGMAAACAALGLAWWHLPLSGRRLEQASDRASLARIPELLAPLRERDPPRGLVVHCAAGMHRTGAVLYLLLRHAGQTPEDAIRAVEQARAVTAAELLRATRRGRLIDEVEALFQRP